MRRATTRQADRRGFTLVELMVAAALCILIMYIMAVAFQTGMDTLSELKSVASLAEQLRTADRVMRRDLGATHLSKQADDTVHHVRVSDVGKALIIDSDPVLTAPWDGTNNGFFKVVTNPAQDEGTDGVEHSYRAVNDWVHFTAKLATTANADADRVFAALAPPAFANHMHNMTEWASPDQVASVWGEVLYFLASSGQTTPPDSGATEPLYTLHRRTRVLARPDHLFTPVNLGMSFVDAAQTWPEVALQDAGGGNVNIFSPSATGGVAEFANRMTGTVDIPPSPPAAYTPPHSPPTVAMPDTQLQSLKFPETSQFYGNDIVLSNVLSMKIQVMYDDIREDVTDPSLPPVPFSMPYYQDVPAAMNLKYDTFNTVSYTVPAGGTHPSESGRSTPDLTHEYSYTLRLRAIRIQLRIYDPKNLLTRQITITQDL